MSIIATSTIYIYTRWNYTLTCEELNFRRRFDAFMYKAVKNGPIDLKKFRQARDLVNWWEATCLSDLLNNIKETCCKRIIGRYERITRIWIERNFHVNWHVIYNIVCRELINFFGKLRTCSFFLLEKILLKLRVNQTLFLSITIKIRGGNWTIRIVYNSLYNFLYIYIL